LVTGFQPFGGSPVNPSELLVERLQTRGVPGLDLHTIVLPVVGGTAAGSAWATLRPMLDSLRPEAVVCLGEAHTREAISLERVAVNLRDYRMADNAGTQVRDEPIVAEGPAAHFATLALREMCEASRKANAPCELSLSAGAFLCNEIMYRVLEYARTAGAPARAGFVHLPQLPQQHALRPSPAAPMTLEAMESGVRGMLSALV
jgi:pyroglutamyl-peptidase